MTIYPLHPIYIQELFKNYGIYPIAHDARIRHDVGLMLGSSRNQASLEAMPKSAEKVQAIINPTRLLLHK